MVKLRSSDDRIFEVEPAVAKMSVTIKNMLEGVFDILVQVWAHSGTDLGDDNDVPIPIPNVSGNILAKVKPC